MAVRDHKLFSDSLEALLARQTQRVAIRGAIFAAAGVVEGDRCALTNNAWIVDAAELRARFGFTGINIINDFEAIAWSLPRLTGNDLRIVGGGEPVKYAPMVALGPGTGLGVAAYIPRANGAFVLHSEGGHATVPSGSPREDAIIEYLRQRFGHVSVERVLSGQGLENLYCAIAAIDSLTAPERSAAEIRRPPSRALPGQSPPSIRSAPCSRRRRNFALGFCAQGGCSSPRDRSHSHYLPRSHFGRASRRRAVERVSKTIPVY
jgi:glucokinase